MASSIYQLNIRIGPTPGKIFPLGKSEITVGCDLSNEIVLNDPEISRRHSRLTLLDAGLLTDRALFDIVTELFPDQSKTRDDALKRLQAVKIH